MSMQCVLFVNDDSWRVARVQGATVEWSAIAGGKGAGLRERAVASIGVMGSRCNGTQGCRFWMG